MSIPNFENPPPAPIIKYYYLGKEIQQCSKEELLEGFKYAVDSITKLTNDLKEAEMSKIEWMGIASKLKFSK